MRILLITFDTPSKVGGLEARAINYSKELNNMGHKVVLAIFAPTITKNPDIDGVTIFSLKSSLHLLINSVSEIMKIINIFKIESIFFITGGTTLIGSILLLLNSINKKTAILIYGKDILTAKRNKPNWIIFQMALILSRKVGVNSLATARLLPVWTQKKTRLLYPAVDPRFADIEFKKKESDIRKIIFIGRLIKRKGCEDLIKAFKLLQEEVQDTELEIIGDGPESERLKELSEKLGIEDKVSFSGELIGKNLFQRISESDIFCMPSKTLDDDVEGFGIVFLEAGLLGKPSVGTWSGGIPEAVVNNRTGLLVSEGNILEIKDALRKLLENPAFSKELGDKARERVLNSFTWRKATEKLLKIYKNDKL